MKRIIALAAVVAFLTGCYIPPRPLPNWKAERMERRGGVPCSAFSKGQSLGNGKKVVRVGHGYVQVRVPGAGTVNIECYR
jgi:hypothetical protein